MKLNKIGEVWNGSNRLLSNFFGLLSSKNFATRATWRNDVSSLWRFRNSVFLKRWPTWIFRSKNFDILAYNNDIQKTVTPSNHASRITRYYGHFPLFLGKALTFSLNSLNTRTPVNRENGHLFLARSIDSHGISTYSRRQNCWDIVLK